LNLETLENREVPAVGITVDYSYDLRANGGSGFFEDRPDAKVVLNQVAQEMGQRISSNLSAITPSGTNTWTASFFNPVTGGQATIPNLNVPANTLIVYAGARPMSGGEAGVGGYGGYGWSGSSSWGSTVQTRGVSGFATWGGSIAFDTTKNWHFGLTTAGLDSNEVDFYSVATHELGHLLGIGTAPQWNAQISGSFFVGPNSQAVYGGPVPLNGDRAHWADNLTVGGQPVELDPTLNHGVRVSWSSLDQAALLDLGWSSGSVVPPLPPPPVVPPSPPPPVVPPTLSGTPVLVSTPDGKVDLYVRASEGTLTFSGRTFTPFSGYTGTVRTAVGDFNGDGVADYAFTAGSGIWARTRIINGATNTALVGATKVLNGFEGGAFIAAGDIDRDGKAELVVSADRGGEPLVEIYRFANGGLQKIVGFLPFSAANRNGVRVALGDLNRDGAADLILGTGAGQAPRVAIYDGAILGTGRTVTLRPSFLAFSSDVGVGVNVAAGDVNGDGYDDLIVSQDSGGTSQVRVWSGASITANPGVPISSLTPLHDFFANGTTDRSGIRIATRDFDGDGKDEIVTAPSSGASGWLRVLSLGAASITQLETVIPNRGAAMVAALHVEDASTDVFEGFLLPGGPCLCCTSRPETPYCKRVSG
jgi:hypothetical protein